MFTLLLTIVFQQCFTRTHIKRLTQSSINTSRDQHSHPSTHERIRHINKQHLNKLQHINKPRTMSPTHQQRAHIKSQHSTAYQHKRRWSSWW
jgi:acetoin utilization deacetylase AcuC-like enzyme